jgi:hypothetical protein
MLRKYGGRPLTETTNKTQEECLAQAVGFVAVISNAKDPSYLFFDEVNSDLNSVTNCIFHKNDSTKVAIQVESLASSSNMLVLAELKNDKLEISGSFPLNLNSSGSKEAFSYAAQSIFFMVQSEQSKGEFSVFSLNPQKNTLNQTKPFGEVKGDATALTT